MGKPKYTRPARRTVRRRRVRNVPSIPVVVLPFTVNWINTANSGRHDIHPKLFNSTDDIFRPSSTKIVAASPAPCLLQISCVSEGLVQFQTASTVIGPTPRTFKLKAPRNLVYCQAANCRWTYVVGGPCIITGIATFTAKSSIDTLASQLQLETVPQQTPIAPGNTPLPPDTESIFSEGIIVDEIMEDE